VFLDFSELSDFVMCWQCRAWMKTYMVVRKGVVRKYRFSLEAMVNGKMSL